MSATSPLLRTSSVGLVREARVVDAHPGEPLVLELPGGERFEAKLAVLGAYEARPGDLVLCVFGEEGAAYVVGVLRSLRVAAPLVVGADGVTAGVDAEGRIWVRDTSGRLVFEHGKGLSVVHAPEGDLAFVASEGAVRFEAKRIALEGEDVTLTGTRLETRFERVLSIAETVDARMGRLVERARETYREVEELAQTRASRLRMVATKTMHLLGQRTLLKAEADVKLKGDKIYLG